MSDDNDVRTDAHCQQLLDRWADADAEERRSITERIRSAFEETLAIFVLDMSGFSSSVASDGIIPFLGRVSQMRAIAVPAMEQRGGEVVKFIADDVMAAFPTADAALAAALEIRAATAVDLGVTQADMRFQVCIGIGFGPLLHVARAELWGDEVNLAFKLGEDTADPGEILITQRAFDALTNQPARAETIECASPASTFRRTASDGLEPVHPNPPRFPCVRGGNGDHRGVAEPRMVRGPGGAHGRGSDQRRRTSTRGGDGERCVVG